MIKIKSLDLWVAIKITRGFADEAMIFLQEDNAKAQVRNWRKNMNQDYDEADYLKVDAIH